MRTDRKDNIFMQRQLYIDEAHMAVVVQVYIQSTYSGVGQTFLMSFIHLCLDKHKCQKKIQAFCLTKFV